MPDYTVRTLLLRPRDPLLLRDGRPFAADPGARARTLEWPLPQTVAGALRSHIGGALDYDWGTEDGRRRARSILVHGPLPVARRAADVDWTVYVPAPRDALLYHPEGASDREARKVWCLRPVAQLRGGAGCDLPEGLLPLQMNEGEDFKPAEDDPYWTLGAAADWLAQPVSDNLAWLDLPRDEWPTLAAPRRDTRVHVSINWETGTSAEGRLFSSESLAFADASVTPRPRDGTTRESPALALLCRVSGAREWDGARAMLPLGGERRLAALDPVAPAWPAPDARVVKALTANGNRRLRLQLVTPAIFGQGWLPDGHRADHFRPVAHRGGTARRGTLPPRHDSPPEDRALWPLEGLLPDLQDVGPRLRLVGAIVGRRLPISGWSLTETGDGRRTPGAKATRFAVPAGSVYFFKADRPLTEVDVRRLWLRSICGRQQDRLDGYGLVLPGVWGRRGETKEGRQ